MPTVKSIVTDSRIMSLLAGFIGAFLPTIGRFLAIIDVPQNQVVEYPHINFWIGGVIMGLIGLFYVTVLGEKNGLKALGQGAGAPALLSTGGTVGAMAISFLISMQPIAYAMERPLDPIPTDSIELMLIVECKDTMELIAHDKIYFIHDTTTIKIPRYKRVKIRDNKSSVMFVVPQKDSAIIKININKRKGGRNFLDGFLPLQRKLSQKMAPRSIEVNEHVKEK